MDIEEFDYADMHFTGFSKGTFFYEGEHEGYMIKAGFKPNNISEISLGPTENFKDLGWSEVRITDRSGNVVYQYG